MTPFSLNIRGKLREYETPVVMGIINVTPDSFFAASRVAENIHEIAHRTAVMIEQGAEMLDLGGYSSRPGAYEVSPEEELHRIETGLKAIRSVSPDIPVSVDTFRASVAREAVQNLGADIVNDISGGDLDPDMFQTVAGLRCPYILMHMRGNPVTMQSLTDYPEGVTAHVLRVLAEKVQKLSDMGVADIILDPGFGFAKTLSQNYELLREMETLQVLERPVLAAVSRKSMITRLLSTKPEYALNGTTVINTLALDRGAAILRVHDVRPAVEAVKIYTGMLTADGSANC